MQVLNRNHSLRLEKRLQKKMGLKSVKDANVRGKRVILRAGLNVPIAGDRVIDSFRLARAAKTVEFLVLRGARVVILGHLGRAGESIRPALHALEGYLGKTRIKLSETSPANAGPDVSALKDGEVMALENVRRFLGEEENDPALASALAVLGDIFVNDAFADSHREHASVVGIAKLLPSYAGLLIEEEVAQLSRALLPPRPAIAIIGGAKFETKEPLIEKLATIYDRVCVGGAIVNDFFKAKGLQVGASLVSAKGPSPQMLANPRIEIPVDIVAATETTSHVISPTEVRADERIADAGPMTGRLWSEYIHTAEFVLMNGPLGIYEKGFNAETESLARSLSTSKARAVVGGGDTIAALTKTHFDPERIFLSTGGGAMLEFLADGTLPGLEPLRK
jgi:phosphoglycerate kinase